VETNKKTNETFTNFKKTYQISLMSSFIGSSPGILQTMKKVRDLWLKEAWTLMFSTLINREIGSLLKTVGN
jgi:hypothetical protein